METKGFSVRSLFMVVGVLMLLSAMRLRADNDPLCFTARNGKVTVTFNIKNVTPSTIEYSTNKSNWYTCSATTTVTLQANNSVYFRAATDKTSSNAIAFWSYSNPSRFSFSSSNGGTVEASGNIMSLYGPSCPDIKLPYYAFCKMFASCKLLTTPPELPATNLGGSCYENMFDSCSSLTVAPALPATTLAYGCYWGMFWGCSSLTEAPALPATTLANSCYRYMFYGCSSLTEAPALPATTLADYCYYDMFSGCSSLTEAPALPATTLANSCYDGMFWDCSSLTEAPALPATTLADYCYEGMFYGCSSLTEAPALPATTLADVCYAGLFYGCSSLIEAPALPATTLADYCYEYMFSGCSSLTEAPALPATTLADFCYYGMFYGCSSLTETPVLPATTLASSCYSGMFYDCSSLKNIPTLPATVLPDSCYYLMFAYCNSLIVNKSAPGISWRISSYNVGTDALYYMFYSTAGTMNGTPSVNTTYYVYIPDSHVYLYVNDADMGSVVGGGTYPFGQIATLTATPNEHYHFVRWSNGDTSPTIQIAVKKDTTLTAIFAIDQHNVAANVNDSTRGNVSGSGCYDYGQNVTLTATPNEHYFFDVWDNGETTPTLTFTLLRDTAFTATFMPDSMGCNITLLTNDTSMGNVAGGGMALIGRTITLTAMPNEHYRFVKWSNGETTPNITLTATHDTTLTAYFERDVYTVTTIVNNAAMGSVTGGGTYDNGQKIILTAIPNEDCYFVQWSNGVTTKSINMMVSCDITLTAVFDSCSENIIEDYATIVRGEVFYYKNSATDKIVEIKKAGDYTFTYRDADGCKVTHIIHLDVVEGTGVENVTDIDVKIIPNPVNAGTTALVYGDFGEVERVDILNESGQVVESFMPSSSPIEICGIEAAGVYHARLTTQSGEVYVRKLIVK